LVKSASAARMTRNNIQVSRNLSTIKTKREREVELFDPGSFASSLTVSPESKDFT
jgi:hypothetical protein